MSFLLTCACTYDVPEPVNDSAARLAVGVPESNARRADVERANRCLALVNALEPARRWVDAEILFRTGLDALDPGVAVGLLREAEQAEARSGLPRDQIAAIQQHSTLTIGSEAELERLAPEIRDCAGKHLGDSTDP
jgi:hypothetical protein